VLVKSMNVLIIDKNLASSYPRRLENNTKQVRK